MNNEYEIIHHPRIKYLNPFIVNLSYRNSHLHSDFEICLLLEGECSVHSKNESDHLSKHSMILFNPIQPHELRAHNESALILSLQISHKFCTHYFPSLGTIVFDVSNLTDFLSLEHTRSIQSLIIELTYNYFCKPFGYELMCLSLLNQMFYRLLQWIPFHAISEDERATNMQRLHRINRIINYIEENYSSKLLLTTIADREDLSLSYMSHFFKENLNMTFQEYLNQVRFVKAKQLLLQTNMKLIDICLESGFSDTRYLNNMFVKQYGYTPKQFRAQHHKLYAENPNPSRSIYQSFYSDHESLELIKKHRQEFIDEGHYERTL